MQSVAVGKRSHGSAPNSCASLSVVLVSTGSLANTRRAMQAVNAASRDLCAQLIVVAQANDPAFAKAVEREGAQFVSAPHGCSRAEMCDLGMSRVSGAIVAVRDDVCVGDASWIDAYRGILPKREPKPVALFETVVLDSQVAARAPLADNPVPARAALELRSGSASMGMSAAI